MDSHSYIGVIVAVPGAASFLEYVSLRGMAGSGFRAARDAHVSFWRHMERSEGNVHDTDVAVVTSA